MDAMDDEGDYDDMLTGIIYGVLHHPAQRDMGSRLSREGRSLIFGAIQEWWENMSDEARDEYRQKLSRQGVKRGENHKEGEHDTGHGCGHKLGMHKNFAGGDETLEDRIAGAAADAIIGGVKDQFSNMAQNQAGRSEAGGLEGFISGVAGNILGDRFKKENTESYRSEGYSQDGGYSQESREYGREGGRYGEAEYRETQYDDGSRRSEYTRYEQDDGGRGESYSRHEERTETRYGGEESYGRREESYGGGYGGGQEESYGRREESYGGGYGGGREESYGRRDDEEREESYGRRRDDEGESGGGGFLGGLVRSARDAIDERRKEREEEGRRW